MRSTERAGGAPRARHIPDLPAIHAQELEFLWGQRRAGLGSPDFTMRALADLHERIEAHLQGLLVVPQALAPLLDPLLECGERDVVMAAAYGLLRLGAPAGVARVLSAFANARGEPLAGLRDALSACPARGTAVPVEAQFRGDHDERAVAAAVVLANRGVLESDSSRLAPLLTSADARIAELAWRAVQLADRPESAAPRPYRVALRDGAPPVRDAVLAAAAWTAQPWLLDLVRGVAAGGDRIAARWLAILGTPEDLPFMLRCGHSQALGTERCRMLARYGHPQAIALTLEWMRDPDPGMAQAAGEAFERMTGLDVRGERRTLPVAHDADDFAREFAPDIWLADVQRARVLWEQHRTRWQAGTRWCRGVDLGSDCTREVADRLDLQSRWDAGARAASAGRRILEPPQVYC